MIQHFKALNRKNKMTRRQICWNILYNWSNSIQFNKINNFKLGNLTFIIQTMINPKLDLFRSRSKTEISNLIKLSRGHAIFFLAITNLITLIVTILGLFIFVQYKRSLCHFYCNRKIF